MIHRHIKNVVLGAGAMGSATAYQLARRGEPVLLVEQFAIGHDRGSSHGLARITRHSSGPGVSSRPRPGLRFISGPAASRSVREGSTTSSASAETWRASTSPIDG
jgi:glycine/D-amino acid oxidase-like deaminating enzyme